MNPSPQIDMMQIYISAGITVLPWVLIIVFLFVIMLNTIKINKKISKLHQEIEEIKQNSR